MRFQPAVLVLLALARSHVSWAQSPVDAGTVIIGGSARFGRSYDQGSRQHEVGFSIAPQLGVFAVDGFALSLNGQIGWAKRDETATAFSWALGPGVTYYLDGLGSRVFPYASLRTLWSRTRFEPEGPSPLYIDRVERESSWTGAVGAALFVATHVAVAGELYYSKYRVEIDLRLIDGQVDRSRNNSENYGLQFGLRIFLY